MEFTLDYQNKEVWVIQPISPFASRCPPTDRPDPVTRVEDLFPGAYKHLLHAAHGAVGYRLHPTLTVVAVLRDQLPRCGINITETPAFAALAESLLNAESESTATSRSVTDMLRLYQDVEACLIQMKMTKERTRAIIGRLQQEAPDLDDFQALMEKALTY